MPKLGDKVSKADREKVMVHFRKRARKDKAFANKKLKDKKWMNNASIMSKEMVSHNSKTSIEQLAKEDTDYLIHRAHLKGTVYGSETYIAQDKRREYQKIIKTKKSKPPAKKKAAKKKPPAKKKPSKRKKKNYKQTGKSQTKRGKKLDSRLKAKKPGKRTSKSGRKYTETRRNRSDSPKRRK